MTLMGWATRVLQRQLQKEAMTRVGANPQKLSHSRLFSATREHEDGITSNRGSARHGESVPEPCTHRPSRSGNRVDRKHSLLYSQICLILFFFKIVHADLVVKVGLR